jgi:3-deoxy-manno-octulosonate cytidylyltransferase (CMP-KDO synthetase)
MTQKGFIAVIPARYASSRLPGKAIADIDGVPMVIRVYRRAAESGAVEVIIATDDSRVAAVAADYDAQAEMTAKTHASGTDRIAEVAEKRGWDRSQIVVNVQGDEPLIPPILIDQVARLLADHPSAAIATLVTPFRSEEEFRNPSNAKVVTDSAGRALYFSRAGIPFVRDDNAVPADARRHIGLYAYRVGSLLEMAQASPCRMEQHEKLEQLRALWLGMEIVVADALVCPPPGVDTEADLEVIRSLC